MEGTDVSVYKDTNKDHDHTYYGNGCEVNWNVGSTTACSSRIDRTNDNEDLVIGTYYASQAATSGSSGTNITTQFELFKDTFCPIGWQLPYGGTGGDYYDKSKSIRFLLSTYSYEPSDTRYGTKVRSYPFSFIRSGNYRWNTGMLFSQARDGDYWSINNKDAYAAYQFDVGGAQYFVERTVGKEYGQAVRCVYKISILTCGIK